jgi:2-oxoglutarate dehydrogenase E2 component (dihydrolipoamide succinyltransferase)
MSVNVIMPKLGESVVEGTLNRWLKQPGETVREYEPLCEVTTDKVDTEIPAPATGVLLAVHVAEGQTVAAGTLLAVIGEAAEQPAAPPHLVTPSVAPQTPSQATAQAAATRYSPVVMRMAAEHGIDLSALRGTGLGGRVTKKDVEAYLESKAATAPALAAWEQPGGGDLFKPTDEIYAKASGTLQPAPVATPTPALRPPTPAATPVPAAPPASLATPAPSAVPASLPGELRPISTMRRLIAEHMVRSKLHTAPHVTTVFEVDMSRVMAHWKANEAPFAAMGLRLTLTAYFVSAIVRAAQAHPTLNARWTDSGLFLPSVVNVGMAVALEEGLIVPVIRNAGDLNLQGVARAVTDLATRARAKALRPDETADGTITLTNHGVSGSLFATPVINQPQSAIVGVGAVQKRVVVVTDSAGADMIAIRPMLYATLTFDHRVADGAMGDAFMRVFKETLEGWA